jgi:hypothetical protein
VPWKGFFDLIGRCDEYVIFDSVQYVKLCHRAYSDH